MHANGPDRETAARHADRRSEQEAAGIRADSVIARRVDEVASRLRRRCVEQMLESGASR